MIVSGVVPYSIDDIIVDVGDFLEVLFDS